MLPNAFDELRKEGLTYPFGETVGNPFRRRVVTT
jgi:hypothetical protein